MEHINLVLIVLGLVGLSAIFSGLNIAFMSLAPRDLRHKAKLGDRNAQKVVPLRQRSHLTLASILYANVGAVTATGLVIGEYTGGLIAGFVSTILLVIFGEIIPQAYFSRAALRFTGRLVPFLYFTIVVTYILSKPTSILLDRMLPRIEHPLRGRDELGLLVREYKGPNTALDDDEVEIIQGALQLSEKQIGDIMTPIGHAFWLSDDAVLDTRLVQEIKQRDYSRVPVLDRDSSSCYGVLLMKDMIAVDFATKPVAVTDFRLHECEVVGSRTALDTMLRKFLSSATHLALVERAGQIVGLLTIEDLIEEIVGHEITDESDRDHGRE